MMLPSEPRTCLHRSWFELRGPFHDNMCNESCRQSAPGCSAAGLPRSGSAQRQQRPRPQKGQQQSYRQPERRRPPPSSGPTRRRPKRQRLPASCGTTRHAGSLLCLQATLASPETPPAACKAARQLHRFRCASSARLKDASPVRQEDTTSMDGHRLRTTSFS